MEDAAHGAWLPSIDLLPCRAAGDHVIIGDGRLVSLKERGVV